MSIRILFLLAIFSALAFQNPNPVITKWVITSGCSLKVDGSTNINKFNCIISNYNRPDTITISKGSKEAILLNGNIQLSVDKFDCHNPVMTADLRKTMKAKEFPKLMIFFVSMSHYPDLAKNKTTKGIVQIALAGVSKVFEVDYKLVSADKNQMVLEGSRQVHFSDFNLTPPRKLGGMIKTNNELNVLFQLKMKILN